MDRLTLHEAQERVAAIGAENGGRCPVVIRWEDPLATVGSTLRHAHQLLPRDERAAVQIADALLAYHAHLAFEAGRAFSDAATLAYVDANATRVSAATYRLDAGAVLTVLASELRDGLHYAEPEKG